MKTLMRRGAVLVWLWGLFLWATVACNAVAASVAEPTATATLAPSETPMPTITPTSTATTPVETNTPISDAGEVPANVLEFVAQLSAAFQTPDLDFLLERLHPEVLQRYGAQTCQAYLPEIVDPTRSLTVISLVSFGQWQWDSDGLSTVVPDVYVVEMDHTFQGETTRFEGHFGMVDDMLYWFTDCGTPAP